MSAAGERAGPAMLVVTHGRLAEELVHAARTIVGSVDGLEALSIDWKEEIDSIQARLSRAIESLDRGGGVIVATDMFGGTPTNLALALHERGRIEIVTGVNLPMLIRFAGLGERLGLVEAAGRIAREGREAIHVASDVLDSQPPAGESRP